MQNRQKNIKLTVTILSFIALMVTSGALADSKTRMKEEFAASAMEKQGFPIEFELIPTVGYRVDDLDWNTAGDASGNNPNILSELTWDDLESYQVKIQGNVVLPNIIALKGSAGYGWIFDGDNQDSDYLGDNRTFEFSRSNNTADDGHVWDASLAIGYPFRFGRNIIGTITPLVGYSHHEQKLIITDGNQTIPDSGPFPGLDSTYETEWKGPWAGFDLHFKAREIKTFAHRLEPYLSYEYHWTDYHAEADWNLRNDLAHPKSFEHDADGNGYVICAGLNIWLHHHFALNFNFDYQDWSTDDGTHRAFLADGSALETRLNKVNWTSYALSLGLSLRF
jgi:hypothetical protein